jgi:hypothetical protein
MSVRLSSKVRGTTRTAERGLHAAVARATIVSIRRMRQPAQVQRRDRAARLAFAAGALAACALAATPAIAQAPGPVAARDPQDAGTASPDLTRVQLGLTSDRRLRAALTLVAGWVPRDLLASQGPPGSLCLRLWTTTRPGAAAPDYLACITSRADGETLRGTMLKTRAGQTPLRVGLGVVGRTSARTATLRFSQASIGRPRTIRFAAEATKPGCARVSCVDTAPNAPATLTLRLR